VSNDPSGPPRWRDTQRHALREQIADASLTLFAGQGYAATTYDQIADRAGVSRRTVFNHFPRKRDFLEFWSRRRRDALAALSEDGKNRRSGAAGTLRELMAWLADVNEDQPDVARALVTGWLTEFGAVTEPFPVFEAFRAAVQEGQSRGELRADQPSQLIAEVLTACYTDALERWLGEGDDLPRGRLKDQLWARLDVIVTGISAGH
jgi:AcrR family transcriptional regulator